MKRKKWGYSMNNLKYRIVGKLKVGVKGQNTIVFDGQRTTNLTAYLQTILENLNNKEVEVIVTPASILIMENVL